MGKWDALKWRTIITACLVLVINREENTDVSNWEFVTQPVVHPVDKILCDHLNYNFKYLIITWKMLMAPY